MSIPEHSGSRRQRRSTRRIDFRLPSFAASMSERAASISDLRQHAFNVRLASPSRRASSQHWRPVVRLNVPKFEATPSSNRGVTNVGSVKSSSHIGEPRRRAHCLAMSRAVRVWISHAARTSTSSWRLPQSNIISAGGQARDFSHQDGDIEEQETGVDLALKLPQIVSITTTPGAASAELYSTDGQAVVSSRRNCDIKEQKTGVDLASKLRQIVPITTTPGGRLATRTAFFYGFELAARNDL